MVFSPAPVFRFPTNHLIINLASAGLALLKRLTIMFYLRITELDPLDLDIKRKLSNTSINVSFTLSCGSYKATCSTTIPKSPSLK